MDALVPLVWLAGVFHLVIAASNVVVPRVLDYRTNLAKVSPMVRRVFIVHAAYILLILLGFSGLCFFFAPILVGGGPLGISLSGFMAVFWLARVVVQVWYYDASLKKQHRLADTIFTLMFGYLGGIFFVAAVGSML